MEKKSVTLSQMTTGQIDKVVSSFRALLEKHSKEIDQDLAQKALGDKRLVDDMVSTFYRYVDLERPMIVLNAKVDISLNPAQFLATIDAQKNFGLEDLKLMPRTKISEVEVCFFKLHRYVSNESLDEEYELRGLDPADPISQIAVNIANPWFIKKHSNATQWNPGLDNYFSTIMWGFGKPVINIGVSNTVGFGNHWWFAGIPKKQ